MTTARTKIITPLNEDAATYAKLYRKKLPPCIVVSINTLTTDAATFHNVHVIRRRIQRVATMLMFPKAEDRLGLHRLAPCPIAAWTVCQHPFILDRQMEALLTSEQQAWLVNGCYTQVAFHRPWKGDEEHVHDGTGFAMTLIDRWVTQTKSVDPSAHAPFPVDAFLAEHYEEAVSNFYASGVALWHENLVRLRNELAIAVRAASANENVLVKLNEFRALGKGYFLV